MRTIKYWWGVFIWRPLDIADRILLLVGAISGYLQKGDDPVTLDLAWQIPLGIIIVFLMWRIMQIPVRILDDIRREKNGEYPITLESLNQKLQRIENTLELQKKAEPKLKIEDIERKIFCEFKSLDNSMIGSTGRAIIFRFEVSNASHIWINTTGNVKGDLSVFGERLRCVCWQTICNGIETDTKGVIDIIYPVSERFAKSLAFMPKDGRFLVDFSEMYIEIETKDNQQKYTLGYITIGNKYEIPIGDHMTFQKIRKIVEWEAQLGEDDRVR